MRVFLAGATGEIGRALVRVLREAGHAVAGLSRRPENEGALGALGVEPRSASLFDEDSLVRAADGCEAVVHVATAIPSGQPRRRAAYAENDRIRSDGTRNLARCAGRIGARSYVQQSIVWVAQRPDGAEFDESSPALPTWWTQSALDGERIAQDTAAACGFDCAVLRCGMFYGPESRHLRAMGRLARWRLLPILRDCDARKAFIHTEDAARAFAAAIERGCTGLWHVVDDEPLPMGDFVRRLTRALRAPAPFELPRATARLLGDVTRSAFLDATVTHSRKLRAELGWVPRFPTTRDGLTDVVERWRSG